MEARRARGLRLVLVWLLCEAVAAWQVQRDGESLLEQWLRTLVRPVAVAAERTASFAGDLAWALVDHTTLVAERRRLQERLDAARSRLVLMEEDLRSLRELAHDLDSLDLLAENAVPARCHYRDSVAGYLHISAGLRDGVHKDDAVVSGDGLVGRIFLAGANSAWVELISNPAAAVAVQDPAGSLSGLAVGTGSELEIRFVPSRASLLRGDLLVSSGEDGLYPAGLPVARVEWLREAGQPFLEVRASPAAHLTEVRTVLVVSSRHAGGLPR